MRGALLLLLLLAACSDPSVGAGIFIGPGGVSVAPTVHGTIGGVGVSVGSVLY